MPRVEVMIPQQLDASRLDAALSVLLPGLSRARVQKLIEQGLVGLPGAKSALRVQAGQVFFVQLPDQPEETAAQPQDIPLWVLHEDDDLIVINKPRGIVVHPSAGHPDGTLVNALLNHCTDLSGIGGLRRPGIVHRHDKDTTGALLAAKNDGAHQHLSAQFKARTALRVYWALVEGSPKQDEGEVDAPVGRHPRDRQRMAVVSDGRGAVTRYRVLARFDQASLVACSLVTGRTHQIRVHMAHIGHPLLGDGIYGRKKQPAALKGQMLHGRRLGFIHPGTGRWLEVTGPLWPDFEQWLNKHGIADADALPAWPHAGGQRNGEQVWR